MYAVPFIGRRFGGSASCLVALPCLRRVCVLVHAVVRRRSEDEGPRRRPGGAEDGRRVDLDDVERLRRELVVEADRAVGRGREEDAARAHFGQGG